MQNQSNRMYTTTTKTFDADAIAINDALNDVARMCRIGHTLNDVLLKHFNGSVKLFKRWVRSNLDKDEKSILRYICLAENQDLLEASGIIRLSEAYMVLGIDGNSSE